MYLVTCPEGICNYRQGNLRAQKRLDYAKGLIAEIGICPESLEIVRSARNLSLDALARKLLGLPVAPSGEDNAARAVCPG